MSDIIECVSKANEYLPIFSALVGACVAGAILYINNLATIKSSERKHHREIMINTSFNHWKEKTNMAISVGGHVECDPLESYIVSLLVFSESLSDKKITKENIIEILKYTNEIDDLVSNYQSNKHKKEKQQK